MRYFRLGVVLFIMAAQGLIGSFGALLYSGSKLRAFRIRRMQRNAAAILRVLGIKVNLEGLENWNEAQAYMVVSNHLSYIDTLLFAAAARPVCLVSTIEVRDTPFVGWVVSCSGCLFVERRSREKLREEIQLMADTLKEGFSLVFFPEGTSTNGSSVLEFKSSLFAPAQRGGVPVLPVVVQLERVNGEPVSEKNRDLICYHSDMEFFPHLLSLAGRDDSEISLRVLPAIPVGEKTHREELAEKSRAAIVANYRSTDSRASGSPDSRASGSTDNLKT